MQCLSTSANSSSIGMPLSIQYGTALVLLLLVLSLTLVATFIRTTMRRRREW